MMSDSRLIVLIVNVRGSNLLLLCAGHNLKIKAFMIAVHDHDERLIVFDCQNSLIFLTTTSFMPCVCQSF